MKLIHNFKSPNFNERNSNKIELVIIHYTAINSLSESIKHLCSKKTRVSSHYLVSKTGDIYSLVSEKNRAWHAGQSYWQGETDINSNSIGIELDYDPSIKNNKYKTTIVISLTKLLKKIIKKHQILPEKILGHSDISPYRKKDPGINFPWSFFEKKKLAYKINFINKKTLIKELIYRWFLKYQIRSQRKKILFMLNFIGYDISLALKNRVNFKQLIYSYSIRYRYYKTNSHNLKRIIYVIELHFLNIILTKLKK